MLAQYFSQLSIFSDVKNHTRMTDLSSPKPANAQATTPPLDVLAKDRHYLTQLRRKLAKADQASADYQRQLVHYQDRLVKSEQAVAARRASLPAVTLNPDLPVSQQADTLVQAIIDHQVIIVAGETGSGKTTQLPKIALLAGRGMTGQIGHTQPRRLAARSVATRIAEELGEPLGQTVSFKVRFTEQGSQDSLIKLMTDGILLAELAHDRFLSRYDTLIIDEAHERSLNIDFILGYLKNLLPQRPDLKVIITSATLDTERFSRYFALPPAGTRGKNTHNAKPAPVFVVEGRSYPVEVRYRPVTDDIVHSTDDDAFDEVEDNLPRAITAAVEECYADAASKGHSEQADILIFAATEAEIHDIADTLHQYAPKHTQILPLYARQNFAEQQQIFAPSGGRRIIIATNVAETALTVPNIRYVIDLGFARISRYDYRSRVQRLPIEAISQAAANQRKGRCGRVAPGVCIRLYSEDDFYSRPEFTEPEILRTNLASVILQMANLRLGRVEDFDFIEPPDSRLVNDGRKLLHELGAIGGKPAKRKTSSQAAAKTNSPDSDSLTKIGQQMAHMPIDPRLARMLLAGEQYACLQEMLVIVSALSVQDPRERPADKTTQADQKHALFRQPDSDFLFYLSLWQAIYGSLFATTPHDGEQVGEIDAENFADSASFDSLSFDNIAQQKLTNSQRKAFAKKHFLSSPRLREWQQTHSQLSQLVNTLKLKHNQEPAGYLAIHRALLTGLLSFIAHKVNDVDSSGKIIKSRRGEYLVARQHKAKIFPASTLFKQNPTWVMAFDIVETSNVFMRTVAKIEPEWILAQAGDLLKYHYFEPHWSAKTGHVKAYAQISLFGLIVVHKQLVNYERINLAEAHDIFLRDALVLGGLNTPSTGDSLTTHKVTGKALGKLPPFLQHNLNKVADVALIEDKLRRRDLLVDEEQLYQFYAKRVPPHIASRKAFEDWRKEIEKTDPQYLFFRDEDVLSETAPATQAFPESWRLGGLTLPLSYVFDPASDDDGVTIKVPLVALPQLDAIEVLWGIAGWRYDLVLQLLKTLPKDIRRQIVPIPDTARAVCDELNREQPTGLLKQLAHALNRRGIRGQNARMVEPKDFNPSQVERYLQPQIALVDDKNRLLDKGRDIEQLKIRHQATTQQAVVVGQGLHSQFPEHFNFIQQRHSAGVLVQQFAALVADEQNPKNGKNWISIQQFTDLDVAIRTHRRGVLALLKNELGAKAKQLTSQIDKPLKLAFAPLGDLEQLKDVLIYATLDATFEKSVPQYDNRDDTAAQTLVRQIHALRQQGTISDEQYHALGELPLTAAQYAQAKTAVLAHFLAIGQGVLGQLSAIYQDWQQIRGRLLMLDRNIFEESMDDIEDQLDDLHLADFVYRMAYQDWQQYPRYLQALLVRLERLEHNLDADLAGVYALDRHMERLGVYVTPDTQDKYHDYRWLVEEFRIQLFAQPMKTRAPVSDKRLEKLWEQLQR